MSLESALRIRSNSTCELCSSEEELTVIDVPPNSDGSEDQCALLCQTCKIQIENPNQIDVNHWRCLNDSMWSTVPAVQVLAWRMLDRLRPEGWPQDLLDMLYLDDETQEWASSVSTVSTGTEMDTDVVHRDSNGTQLDAGDTITLIKDLVVKGAGFTAKRGTAVRSISLVENNSEHIEGRVNGQKIVILTKFVNKAK
jgi:protein PhnA